MLLCMGRGEHFRNSDHVGSRFPQHREHGGYTGIVPLGSCRCRHREGPSGAGRGQPPQSGGVWVQPVLSMNDGPCSQGQREDLLVLRRPLQRGAPDSQAAHHQRPPSTHSMKCKIVNTPSSHRARSAGRGDLPAAARAWSSSSSCAIRSRPSRPLSRKAAGRWQIPCRIHSIRPWPGRQAAPHPWDRAPAMWRRDFNAGPVAG